MEYVIGTQRTETHSSLCYGAQCLSFKLEYRKILQQIRFNVSYLTLVLTYTHDL